jgi:hypothetical protein
MNISKKDSAINLRIDKSLKEKLSWLSLFHGKNESEIVRESVETLFGVEIDMILTDLEGIEETSPFNRKNITHFLKRNSVSGIVKEFLIDEIRNRENALKSLIEGEVPKYKINEAAANKIRKSLKFYNELRNIIEKIR